MYDRRSDAAEDSGLVDRPVDRPYIERAYGETGVVVDRPVDRPEEQIRNSLEWSTGRLTIQKVKIDFAQLVVNQAVDRI